MLDLTQSLAAGFLFLLLAVPPASGDEDRGSPARYLVFEVDREGIVRPQKHQIVLLSSSLQSRTEAEVAAQLAEPPRDAERVSVQLLSSACDVVYQDVVEIPRWLRAEISSDGALNHAGDEGLVPSPTRSFVVRVPVLETSRLVLSFGPPVHSPQGPSPSVAEFDLDTVAADETLPLARFSPAAELLPAAAAANSGNRVDLLVMGDGYTSSQSAQFASDANNVLTNFFSIPPYSTYKNFVNTATLFTASAQSGADHPTYNASCSGGWPVTCCADPLMQSDPKNGTFVSTAFDGSYCYANNYRLLVVDATKVLAAAAAAPDWDRILVIVNDPTYGGSGGQPAVISTNAFAVQISQHEYGHSFTRLTDEYSSPAPGYPVCSDITGPVCEPNVTDQTNSSQIKWLPWIESGTPVPTPDVSAYFGVVGLFEGARYRTTGMYRPRHDCIMRTLGQPFCQICSQEYVLRLYRGGWGVPTSGIDNIEPGSESPTPGPVSVAFPGSVTFTVNFLQPAGGPNLGVTWLVNGTAVPGASSNSYSFTPSAPGTYQVELRTKDTTSLVNATMAGTSLSHGRVWTVTAMQGLAVSLSANPSSGAVPLSTDLSAAVSGTATGTITYTFWWNCSDPGTSVGAVASVCGDPMNPAIGTKFDGVTDNPKVVNQVYSFAGRYTAKVIVERGGDSPAESRATVSVGPFSFFTLAPCRAVDTRNLNGPYGGPALAANSDRTFMLIGQCGIPSSAAAVSINVTVTQPTNAGDLRLYPAGAPLPLVSTINYRPGQTRANNAVAILGIAGELAVHCDQASGLVHFIVDINGYFQ